MIEPSFWRDRPVFVTGATGFLGAWLVKELLSQGADVIVLCRDQRRWSILDGEGLIQKTTIITGELCDRALLQKSFSDYAVDTVFHLASQPLVNEAKRNPTSTFEVNVAGTWNVLEAARQAGAVRVIVASSASVYGASDELPHREEHPACGEYPYNASKMCAEAVASCFSSTYGMAVAITRCSNLFGGGDLNFSRIIPGLIRSTYRGERFIVRSDGKFWRDYLYVRDAVRAYLLLGQRLAADGSLSGEIFNFSLETKISVLELAVQVLSLMERPDLAPVIRNEASCEIREQYLSCEKARRRLEWHPKYSLEDGLRETIGWYAANLEEQLLSVGNQANQ